MLSKELLDIICCPKCRGDLLYEPEKNILTCKKCATIYPIEDDIPNLIIDDESQRQ